jgi:hypothetical protein
MERLAPRNEIRQCDVADPQNPNQVEIVTAL